MKYICEPVLKIFNEFKIEYEDAEDLHVLRFFSSFVVVKKGAVIAVSNPSMSYCPLAFFFYREQLNSSSKDIIDNIRKIITYKISNFGFFTEKRQLISKEISVPYGASEMLMYAVENDRIDVAVLVCDGAGTVITDDPAVIQGIGGRMNGLFYTTPLKGVVSRLIKYGCRVVFENARIDQVKGVEKAAQMGYKRIAVTINALMDEYYRQIERIEKEYGVEVTVLSICTTGAGKDQIEAIAKYADIVWSCASKEVRGIIGRKSRLQLSRKIPVFVSSQRGLDLVSEYCSDKVLIRELNPGKQYIIDSKPDGKSVTMGKIPAFLNEKNLPVRSDGEPVLKGTYMYRSKRG